MTMDGQLQLQGTQTAADGTCKLLFQLQVQYMMFNRPCTACNPSMALYSLDIICITYFSMYVTADTSAETVPRGKECGPGK